MKSIALVLAGLILIPAIPILIPIRAAAAIPAVAAIPAAVLQKGAMR